MSVLPLGEEKPVVIKDIKKTNIEKATLTNILISDGEISFSGLKEIEKNKDWLFERLKVSQKNN